ncbi:beta strand repeat-containing protein [Pelagibius sp.]|uniref:beta strand repeat-containing protein n=1 Tax=Pelagibius sp. TaxID=1931238 RepID=UPI003BB011F9
MTDDLSSGFEGREDITAALAETDHASGGGSDTETTGQAGAVISLPRPTPGQTVEVQAAAGQVYNLDFAPGAAQVQVEGANFILAFDDNGDGTPDSQIVFLDMVTLVEGGDAPSFTVGGVEIGAEVLLSQALALAGTDDTSLETAAGQGPLSGGGSQYNDDFGETVDLLSAQDTLGTTELAFGAAGVEPDEIEFVFVPPPVLVNEIGLGVALRIPDLPGTESAADEEGASNELLQEFNYIELLNTSDDEISLDDVTIEIVNPDGDVITVVIPDGVTIPPGGYIVFYQVADDTGEDGEEIIVARVFDADGNVVDGFEIDDAEFWDLGEDTTDPIAVNVVFRAGEDNQGDQHVDGFAANGADQDGLNNPNFAGAPEGFGSPLLNLDFETFNGILTSGHKIFSRVDTDDTDSQDDWTTGTQPTDGNANNTDEVFGEPDLNPGDPLNDDLDPGQDNPDPLAGQNFLQAEDGGDLLEGNGGPDFLLGAGGDDSLYGGSQDLAEQQAQKILDQFEQLLTDGGEGAAGLDQEPLFSDHNDFLFGEAGNDALYGGSGSDFLIGGQGDDSLDGGTGDDQLFGDGAGEVGGLPEDDLNHAGNDVIAGDALNNVKNLDDGDGGEGGVGEYGDPALSDMFDGTEFDAIAILGGNDSIIAGNGDDLISGDALATDAQTARAYAYADDSVNRADNNSADTGFANDVIDGGEGSDVIGGDAAAIAGNKDAFGAFAEAMAVNKAVFGASQAPVGSDFIDGGDGDNVIAGDALAVAIGDFGFANAVAENSAANLARAGNDTISAGDGDNLIAGDALAFADGAEGRAAAGVSNDASGRGSFAGNDSISAGAGNNRIAGDAMAVATGASGIAFVEAGNTANSGSAGNDEIIGGGNDSIAGDTLADGVNGATATQVNTASGLIGRAGNDSIDAGDGNNRVAGDALAISTNGQAAADVTNTVTANFIDGAFAGNDNIDTGSGNDLVAGDALAVSAGALATVVNKVMATLGIGRAGGDVIDLGGGSDTVAGDALAVGAGGTATVRNDAEASLLGIAQAGNDSITASDDHQGDVIAGDAASTGADGGDATVENNVVAFFGGLASAGNDTIKAGNGDNVVAGDALATGAGAKARVVNTYSNVAGLAIVGSDLIETGSGNDLISGDALATGGGDAEVVNDPTGGDPNNRVSQDTIIAGDGNDTISGDALSVGGVARVDQGGDDSILGGEGDDLIAGDALATGGGSTEVGIGGDDTIFGGGGNDVIYGDASDGSEQTGGADLLYGDEGEDNIFGGGGADTLYGGAGNDDLYGGGGSDELFGGEGSDELFGGLGNDFLDGGAGNDILFGGEGDDVLFGGEGSDKFVFTAADTGDTDTIGDFTTGDGGDVLNLVDLLEAAPEEASAEDLDAFLDFDFDGTDTTITVDLDGEGAGEDTTTIVLQGVDLTALGNNDAEIIQALIDSGNLAA